MANGSRTGAWIAAASVTAAALVLVALSHEWTRAPIAANERAKLTVRLNSVIDPTLRGRDLRIVALTATDAISLGSAAPTTVFVALAEGRPAATVIASIAPHGYIGPIALLIGISDHGTVTGVRTLSHRETPGLGAAVDANDSAWSRQLEGKTVNLPLHDAWTVKQDEGEFDALSGATVTSRAVITAVRDALLYFEQHRDELYRNALAAPPDDASTD
jgi:Na+-translocating ferredoxin:NAD+ oxidoreductase subunit G